jgi:hypothetical protein
MVSRPLARRWLAGFAAALATFTSGCALLQVHRPPAKVDAGDPVLAGCSMITRTDATPIPGAPPGAVDPQQVSTSLCDGIARAEGFRRAYFAAIRWQSAFRNTMSAITIPLAGLAVREGLDPNPSNAKIADFGVASVVLYGWSTTLTSAPRQKVYIDGMQAMSCAMLEAQPLLVAVRQFQTLSAKADSVESAMKRLRAALKAANRTVDGIYLDALAEGRNAIERSNAFGIDVAIAAGNVLPLVNRLSEQVNRNLVDTETSPQALLTLINGFGAQTRAFTKAALPDSPGALVAKQESVQGLPVDPRQKAVDDAHAELLEATEALNSVLAKIVAVSAATAKLQSCKAEGSSNKFVVEPGDAVVVVEAGKTREFTVTNEVAVPTTALVGSSADKVELQETIVRGSAFVVVVKGKEPTNEAGPTLVITDGTGQQERRIVINVKAAPGTAAPAQPAPADHSLTAAEREDLINSNLGAAAAADDDKVKNAVAVVQCVVGAEVDGVMGENTRAAIQAFARSTATPDAQAVNLPLITDVRAAIAAGEPKAACKDATP